MQNFEYQKKTDKKSKIINLAGRRVVNNNLALPIFSEIAVGLRIPAEC
jgi:hypothetical protein